VLIHVLQEPIPVEVFVSVRFMNQIVNNNISFQHVLLWMIFVQCVIVRVLAQHVQIVCLLLVQIVLLLVPQILMIRTVFAHVRQNEDFLL